MVQLEDEQWVQENLFEINAWSRDGMMVLTSQIEAQRVADPQRMKLCPIWAPGYPQGRGRKFSSDEWESAELHDVLFC